MTRIAPLAGVESSIASQIETTLLGESGQYEASWCQLTRLPSPGSLQKKWLCRQITTSPRRSLANATSLRCVTRSHTTRQILCQLVIS